MRNWAEQPPITPEERDQHRKALLETLLHFVGGEHYNSAFPNAADLQTPFLLGKARTGMQQYEWNLLQQHIRDHTRLVAGFWPNAPVIHPNTIKQLTKADIDEKYFQPYIPRLDAVIVTNAMKIVTVEIVVNLTVAAVGEVFFKTMMFQRSYPNTLPIDQAHLLYTKANPVVSSLIHASIPETISSLIKLIPIQMTKQHSKRKYDAQDEAEQAEAETT